MSDLFKNKSWLESEKGRVTEKADVLPTNPLPDDAYAVSHKESKDQSSVRQQHSDSDGFSADGSVVGQYGSALVPSGYVLEICYVMADEQQKSHLESSL